MGNGVFVEAWVLTVSPGSSTQSSSRYAAGLAGEITSEATLISSTRGDEMVVTDSCHHSPSSVVCSRSLGLLSTHMAPSRAWEVDGSTSQYTPCAHMELPTNYPSGTFCKRLGDGMSHPTRSSCGPR